MIEFWRGFWIGLGTMQLIWCLIIYFKLKQIKEQKQ